MPGRVMPWKWRYSKLLWEFSVAGKRFGQWLWPFFSGFWKNVGSVDKF